MIQHEAEMKLAAEVLPRVAQRLRKRFGPDGFSVFLAQLEDEDRYTNWIIADLWGVKAYEVKIYRDALTFNSRKIIPELASLKALSPLKAVYPVVEETLRTARKIIERMAYAAVLFGPEFFKLFWHHHDIHRTWFQ